MARKWYYANAMREQAGPLNDAQLKELADGGTIDRQTPVWTKGMDGWMPAVTVNGLFPKPRASSQSDVPPPLPSVATPAAVQADPEKMSANRRPVAVKDVADAARGAAAQRDPRDVAANDEAPSFLLTSPWLQRSLLASAAIAGVAGGLWALQLLGRL